MNRMNGHVHMLLAVSTMMRAHEGQEDLAGAPYFKHPLRVSLAVARARPPSHVVMAAMLHDAVEDSHGIVSLDTVKSIDHYAAMLVDTLTKRPGEDRGAYIDRIVARGLWAMAIKLADISDNLREDRMRHLPQHVQTRLRAKYKRDLATLEPAIDAADDMGAAIRKIVMSPAGSASMFASG